MRLIFFTFFKIFLTSQLVTRIQSEYLNKDTNYLNDSIVNSNPNKKSFVKVQNESYFIKSGGLKAPNPSNSLLYEKIKILNKENKKQFLKPRYFWPFLDKFLSLEKINNSSNYKNNNGINFRPTLFNLNGPLSNSSQYSITHDLSIDNLKNLVKINLENKHEKNQSKVFLPSYEGFHGETYHNLQSFQHGNSKKNKREIKSADINDYKKWLYDGSKISRLERFKKLYDEFSNLNNHVHDHDFNVKNLPSIQMEKPLKKLKKTIEEIELEEQRKNLKQEL